MFGAALRLLAVGEAGRRLGDYARNLTKRYLMLGIAGIPFVAATAFGILAAFWALNSQDARSDLGSSDHGWDFSLSGLADRAYRLWNYKGGDSQR